MDTIDSMRIFVAVAGQKSFTAGAKQLGISTNLASKHVRQLEARLGAQLIHRTTRRVTLSDTGLAYFERCVFIIDQFDELEGLVQERQSELAGPIRITAPTGFGSRELVEAIRPFQIAHPKVSINLHLSDQHVDILDEGFDLAIRFGPLQNSTLIARKLLTMRLVVFASPEYINTHGEPLHPSDLSTHNCLLQSSSADPEHWAFTVAGTEQKYRVNGSFTANSPRAVAHMAVGGLGIGRCPLYTVEPFLKSGELVLLFDDKMVSVFNLYAVYPSARHLTARIRKLIDHLVTALG
ncbi:MULTISPECIES: LysR family transcriptional regulator [unclassified Shewanella]|jgi:DNA-binding transcriptional LysR family regulator|uniref:LysR family transcriptional regulator n=1 Tax=unclassified Shewanella TaxID=196818 RepID=UPI000C328745|nr:MULTISPECIES: LysR family transcriptional regulator [unclassified Shewanella]MBB1362980.1 LysR family transcriptional regulator [Shewanella sp. SR44-4]PKH29127.1 LysR family transcriptional regulator [Shewanella sp. ALD9]QHS13337.1 LysR family transcriptional regulator [Shewanella sp. Arc9-LZ]|tara:strand:+ start:3167 stop:4048 length:882 start_codon:yes stop_codon:yes gene_type:complete